MRYVITICWCITLKVLYCNVVCRAEEGDRKTFYTENENNETHESRECF